MRLTKRTFSQILRACYPLRDANDAGHEERSAVCDASSLHCIQIARGAEFVLSSWRRSDLNCSISPPLVRTEEGKTSDSHPHLKTPRVGLGSYLAYWRTILDLMGTRGKTVRLSKRGDNGERTKTQSKRERIGPALRESCVALVRTFAILGAVAVS